MQSRWDFAVFRPGGALVAFVEAKRRLGTSVPWATGTRASMIDGAPDLAGKPLLLVAPDTIYFWAGGVAADGQPTSVIDAEPILGPYFERTNIDPDGVDPAVFEEIVGWWLTDLVSGGGGTPLSDVEFEGSRVVRESGY